MEAFQDVVSQNLDKTLQNFCGKNGQCMAGGNEISICRYFKRSPISYELCSYGNNNKHKCDSADAKEDIRGK
jgi:hypothetical protein